MGSGQSARKLTITNEEEIGVIKVSNSLVQRIAQGEKAKANEPPVNAEPTTPAQHITSSAATVLPANATSGHQVYYYPELTMSAHQVHQQKEQELKQQEQYWRKRLRNIDDSYQKINRIFAEEYQKATAEVSTKAGQNITGTQGTVQPCLENSNKVLKCFQSHPKETLACSNLVEEFSNCVWNVHYTHAIEARS
ncbi:MICOS complex subunit mic25 [Harpegnathos saltator]|uniref:Coiled-coil-helix-coiled-coil-helix domain-containing protein 3, mitochondrial n=1 Tax=Harpegnathos saltator TaxID=610380 RepID=E2BQM6_HARSA|nr:MICOS complex subunit mic25 [Harpegnathos saltator]EFN81991.1 hypothetical protein EAI_15655 [Harpegnathos saltator]